MKILNIAILGLLAWLAINIIVRLISCADIVAMICLYGNKCTYISTKNSAHTMFCQEIINQASYLDKAYENIVRTRWKGCNFTANLLVSFFF